jgi:hypothetical protein
MNTEADSVLSRRAALAASALCVAGIAALITCMATGWEVMVSFGGERRTTNVGAYASASGAERDITTMVMALAAASFAASLVISAGILPQMRRLKVPIMFLLASCAMASIAGLALLASSL